MADTITDVTNQINTDIRNKTANKSVTRDNVSDSLQTLANNQRPDWAETDPNALTYIQNKPVGVLSLIKEHEISTWDAFSTDVTIPVVGTVSQVFFLAKINTQFTIFDRTYNVGDLIPLNNQYQSEDNDMGGIQAIIRGSNVIVNPKIVDLTEITGTGVAQYTNSNAPGFISILVRIYG